MLKHILRALCQWLPRFLLRAVWSVIGWFVVAFALPFRQKQIWHGEKAQATLVPYERLPRWALYWDNPWDGINGDDKYVRHQAPKWLGSSRYLRAWYWTAKRNATNFLTRHTKLFAYQQTAIIKNELLAGQPDVFDSGKPEHAGFQFQRVKSNGRWYYGFYLVKLVGKTKMITIRLGNKIHYRQGLGQPISYWRSWVGWTFRPFRFRTRPQFK